MGFDTTVRNCDIGYRSMKASFLMRFRTEAIDVAAASLLDDSIVIKDHFSWRKDRHNAILEFVGAMSGSPVAEFTNKTGKRLIITKDRSVPPRAVTEAVHQTINLLNNGGYSSMGLMFAPDIRISISSAQQRFPIQVPKLGTIIFDSRDLSEEGSASYRYEYFGEGRTKRQAFLALKYFVKDLGLPHEILGEIGSDIRHVGDVISAYYQIPFLCYDPKAFVRLPGSPTLRFIDSVRGKKHYSETTREKSLIRAVWPDVSNGRISGVFNFVQELAQRVPHQVILQAIVGHDVGKIDQSGSHPEVGADYFESKGFLRSWKLEGKKQEVETYRLIIKNVIRHHLVLGGICMGEYSLMCLYDMFTEDDMLKIIAAGQMGLYIDTLTLMTACDMAGQKKAMVPITKRLEDIEELRDIMSNIILRSTEMDGRSKDHIFQRLLDLAVRRSMDRLCRYLGSDDQMLDVNTEGGYDRFYGRKLYEALNRCRLSIKDKKRLSKFLALVQSFPYSAKAMNYVLWKREQGLDQLKVIMDEEDVANENAILFLLYLSKKLNDGDLDGNKLIVIHFVNESGKVFMGERDNINRHPDYIEAFKRGIDKGESSFPSVIVEHEGSGIVMKIRLVP